MDAGCDAIHPGAGPLAGSPGLVTRAANANVGVIGPDPQYLLEAVERAALLDRARSLGLEPVPAASLPAGDEGLEVAGRLGTPLRVIGSHGGAEQRVEHLDDLAAAVQAVRRAAAIRAGEGGVVLLRDDDDAPRIGTVLVGDRHGRPLHLGHLDRSVRHRGRDWLVELGPLPEAWPADVLGEGAVALAEAIHWLGVGELTFLLHDGRAWVEELVPHLPDAWDLVEAVHGVDLVQAQLEAVLGHPLGWEQPAEVGRVAMQARVWHGDPATGAIDEGVLELEVDDVDGVAVAFGVDPGTACSADTEPLLCTLTATGDDRASVLASLSAGLAAVRLAGVRSNLEVLRRVLASDEVAERRAVASTVSALCGARSVVER
jgi:acetyl/propionyl-CoA carboxylase alpha subunit